MDLQSSYKLHSPRLNQEDFSDVMRTLCLETQNARCTDSVEHAGLDSRNSAGYVTKYAPQNARKLIVWCKLTFDVLMEGSYSIVWMRVDGLISAST